jgi:DNA-binding CsgD family transcriptional regulator
MKLPEWLTPEVRARLGVASDRSLASEIGISGMTVRKYRRLLGVEGIPKSARAVWLTPEIIARMNSESDRMIAKDLQGVSRDAVRSARKSLGIPAFKGSGRYVRWPTPTILSELGTAPDAEIARKAGLSRKTIRNLRVRQGVAAFSPDHAWLPPEVCRMLGHVSDQKIAEATGIGIRRVTRRRRQLGIDHPRREGDPKWAAQYRAKKTRKARAAHDAALAQFLAWAPKQLTKNNEK